MATRNEILTEVKQYKGEGQDIIRRKYISELSAYTHNDTLLYAANFPCTLNNVPAGALSIGINDIPGFMTCLNGLNGKKLDLIIHSPGGSLEATDQLVQYLRSKYDYIRAIVPQNAMSAASMLACACDEIVMGKQSAIGPIDPQMTLTRPNGMAYTLPAHSILADFERAKLEIAADPTTANIWIPKLLELPNGMLDLCEKTIALSKSKVAEWLDLYMFSDAEKKRGEEIANWLGDFNVHKTHGRPINYKTAQEKGLKVSLLEDNQELQDKVLSLFHATMITFEVTSCLKIIENNEGKGSYFIAKS